LERRFLILANKAAAQRRSTGEYFEDNPGLGLARTVHKLLMARQVTSDAFSVVGAIKSERGTDL
jgi:hypothetical protein